MLAVCIQGKIKAARSSASHLSITTSVLTMTGGLDLSQEKKLSMKITEICLYV